MGRQMSGFGTLWWKKKGLRVEWQLTEKTGNLPQIHIRPCSGNTIMQPPVIVIPPHFYDFVTI